MFSDSEISYGSDFYDSYYSFEDDVPIESYLEEETINERSSSQPSPQDIPKPPSPSILSDAIALFHSINQSKKALREITGMDTPSLRTHNVPGLIVLPIKDFSLVRNDTRSNRKLDHFIILPNSEDFQRGHPDLAQMIDLLYAKN